MAFLTGQLDNLRRVHISRQRRIRARSEPTEQAPHHVCVYSKVTEAHEALNVSQLPCNAMSRVRDWRDEVT
jgi:hypothetical protein